MTDWYVVQPGQSTPQGPGTTEQLVEAIRNGQVRESSQVCQVGGAQWVAIRAVPEFAAAFRHAQPYPPVPSPPAPQWSPPAFAVAPPQVIFQVAHPAQYAAPVQHRHAKSRVAYVLLALFLGCFGIHNFYAGYFGRASAQLVLTLSSFVLIVPVFIVAFWALIECFATTSDSDGLAFK